MQMHMGSRDGNPDHAFPQLAGSHLSEVRNAKGLAGKQHC